MARTPPLTNFCDTAAADSALSSLSSTKSFIGTVLSATTIPPCAFTSATAMVAALTHDLPTTGTDPVSSALRPILMESDLSQDEKTIIPAMPAQKAIIEEFFIMFLHPFFVEICSAQPELMGVRYFTRAWDPSKQSLWRR
jgi:hypothetical protein